MPSTSLITADQCRAARALLGWTQGELAAHAGSTRMTVVLFERGNTVRASTRRLFRDTLERAGVRFLSADSPAAGGEGVVIALAATAKPSPRPFAFDRDFYLTQAQLIAAVAHDPVHQDIRSGLLNLVRDYESQAQRLAANGGGATA